MTMLENDINGLPEGEQTPVLPEETTAPVQLSPLPAMTFFQQLHTIAPGLDLTMRIKEKNGNYTIEVFPNVGSKTNVKPLRLTGGPAELDEVFISLITPPLQDATAKLANLEEFKESLEKKPAGKGKEDDESEEQGNDEKKADKKTAPKKKAAQKKKVVSPAKSEAKPKESAEKKGKSPAKKSAPKKPIEKEEKATEEPTGPKVIEQSFF